jgi:uncharacterized glyoxalase superfamily protein PhnB
VSNIYPTLRYKDARAAIEWLSRAFGFEQVSVHNGDDGKVVHAEMRLGTGVIMFGSAPDGSQPAEREGVYVALDDVDVHYDRAEAAGAEITYELADTDYGSRGYGAKDPEGHSWWFGTYRPEVDS